MFRAIPVFQGVPGCSRVFWCSVVFRGVPVFRCSGVPVFWCSMVFRGVPVFRCSGVPVFRCSGVPGFSTCRYWLTCWTPQTQLNVNNSKPSINTYKTGYALEDKTAFVEIYYVLSWASVSCDSNRAFVYAYVKQRKISWLFVVPQEGNMIALRSVCFASFCSAFLWSSALSYRK